MNKPLYVVRRTFKRGSEVFRAGSLLEDLSGVKLAKIRLNEGYIIPLPKDPVELEQLCHYCEVRLGVDLRKALAERVSKGSESAAPVVPSASAKPTTTGTKVVTPAPRVVVTPGTSGTPLTK